MIIRPATASDAAEIAPLIISAMEDMAMKFTQSKDLQKAALLFEFFIGHTNNQYSYENTLVAVEGDEIVGSIAGYDGAQLGELRRRFLEHIRFEYGYLGMPENETEAGEFYIDSISVSPSHQNRGIGKLLFENIIKRAESLGFQRVGLLVDLENPKAKSLYERLGFELKDSKVLMGKTYEHLVLSIK